MSDPLPLFDQLIRDMRYAATPAQLQAAKEAGADVIPIDLAAGVAMGHISRLVRELRTAHDLLERAQRAALTKELHEDLR